MKFLATISIALITLMGVNASPYLKYCSLVGYQAKNDYGFVIRATCGTDDTPDCLELNIAHCFANAFGTLWPSMHSGGDFNNTCGNCQVGITKNDTEKYGLLECDCLNGESALSTNHTTIATDTLIVYEPKLGLLCSYGADSAVRSVNCPAVENATIPGLPNPPIRPIRRSLRVVQPWKLE